MNEKPIPYTALALQVGEVKDRLMAAVSRVLDSGNYILGPEVSQFERSFADYCEAKYSLGMDNGTHALILVMKAMGIGPGHEVITAPNSFLASASSIALTGAKPVFVDVQDDLNLDPEKIEAAITPRTRAVMPVHLTGRPARMDQILEIARRHGLKVIEDAAQAVGARYKGRRVGGIGDAACYSLHPMKNLHAFGDGGMTTTNNKELHELLLKARNHGLVDRNRVEFWSYNSRLDEIQAAMLNVQMTELDRWTEERRRMAFRYNEQLRACVQVPDEGPGEYCVYQTYVIQTDRRDALQSYLNENQVDAKVHYPIPIHLQEAAKNLGYSASDFPVTARTNKRILSLPLYQGMTAAQQDRIIHLIQTFHKG